MKTVKGGQAYPRSKEKFDKSSRKERSVVRLTLSLLDSAKLAISNCVRRPGALVDGARCQHRHRYCMLSLNFPRCFSSTTFPCLSAESCLRESSFPFWISQIVLLFSRCRVKDRFTVSLDCLLSYICNEVTSCSDAERKINVHLEL